MASATLADNLPKADMVNERLPRASGERRDPDAPRLAVAAHRALS